MELLQLKYFIVAARYEHMTKAANALHIAQPALSQSVRRLESELGVSLFERRGRNIRLSEEGKLLSDRLIPVFKELESITGELQEASEIMDNTVKINVMSASELMTDIIVKYKELHPDVIFHLSQRDEEDWDIRIHTAQSGEAGGDDHTVLKEEVYAAVPKNSPYAANRSIDLIQLKDASFISLERERAFSKITEGFCSDSGFTPKIICESDNPSMVRNLIGAGLGVGFWPAHSWGMQKSDKVKLLHISRPCCQREMLVTRKKGGRPSELKDDFYEFIIAYFNEIRG